ncbi:MAG: TolC family protein [Alphaproteobacteria bacterium]|nr:TolC family protein [Alphaproteobacteria bacterium]MCB9796548.1 TolC family protein [Alphaproteobacteria bacterium]
MHLSLAALALGLQDAQAAVTFDELVSQAAQGSTTAQLVELDAQLSRARVAGATARLLPSVSVSDSLTSVQLNEARFAVDGETAAACAERLGRECDRLVNLQGTLAFPEQQVNHSLQVSLTQPLWSTQAVMGVVESKTRVTLGALQGQRQQELQAWDLISAYVELQAGVAALELSRRTLTLANPNRSSPPLAKGPSSC